VSCSICFVQCSTYSRIQEISCMDHRDNTFIDLKYHCGIRSVHTYSATYAAVNLRLRSRNGLENKPSDSISAVSQFWLAESLCYCNVVNLVNEL